MSDAQRTEGATNPQQGIAAVNLAAYGEAVSAIVARHMGREFFDYIGSRGQSRALCFMRHSVWAHLRFGAASEISFPKVARIARRDHTAIIHGLRSLYCKVQHEPKTLATFEAICKDLKTEWPATCDVRAGLTQWMEGR